MPDDYSYSLIDKSWQDKPSWDGVYDGCIESLTAEKEGCDMEDDEGIRRMDELNKQLKKEIEKKEARAERKKNIDSAYALICEAKKSRMAPESIKSMLKYYGFDITPWLENNNIEERHSSIDKKYTDDSYNHKIMQNAEEEINNGKTDRDKDSGE